ncbi:hypothetical protein DV532_19615 [Pseudomonas sp. Leaf58]|uniref:hypothetical protein n=1 Tax=Pseudomonas TaxID=286 RepID=UPI0006F70DBA|nr:hypothetical protein [Pseudomonas sp. Leaf58]AYG46371.1 hypothetical protein DV532_19615 [Pseudomonas sp. Leaf58]KQN60191.1 hypothetical protein ASF02_17040 [Pseudomonas sp. Leaf58]
MSQTQPVAPLTIVAIFAGIIEASALATLPFLSDSSQKLYTWFLVGFPFFLTALFFLTLNFNYKSFYNPMPSEAANIDSPIANTLPRECSETGQAAPVTVMFSGPDAYRMMEQQLLLALAQPLQTPQTWRLCNLDKRQCVQLSVSTLEEDVAT